MNDARYKSFRNAADAAFSELSRGSRKLALVVPAPDGNWRVIYSINKAALGTHQSVSWAEMWEQLAERTPEQREDFLWSQLQQLTGIQHPLARRALHDLEFADDSIIRKNQGIGRPRDKVDYVSNHTGYEGGENFEHEGKGDVMNYSGAEDEMYNAIKEHEDWNKGYDY